MTLETFQIHTAIKCAIYDEKIDIHCVSAQTVIDIAIDSGWLKIPTVLGIPTIEIVNIVEHLVATDFDCFNIPPGFFDAATDIFDMLESDFQTAVRRGWHHLGDYVEWLNQTDPWMDNLMDCPEML